MVINFRTNEDKLFTRIFYKIRQAKTRFVIVYGGASSSKSYSAHQNELLHLLTSKHNTLVIRKHASDIYNSCYDLFKNIASSWNLSEFFSWTFSNFKREITNNKSGKRIIFKGVDDPEKLKSIAGIQRILVEEANQLTKEDFLELNRRTRGIKDIQIVLLFNPVLESHWLNEHFFKNEHVRAQTTIIHCTYQDNVNKLGNSFLTADDIAQLEDLKYISINDYNVYVLGQWGKPDVKNAWAHNFSYDKHVGKDIKQLPNLPVYFSIDFNVSPMVCLCFHHWTDKSGMHTHFFEEIALEPGDTYKMAERLKERFGNIIYFARFTGDASGKNRNTVARDGIHNWLILQQALNISDNRMDVPTANPRINDSRSLTNLIFALHPDLKFSASMTRTINELQFTEADAEGNILKANRTDPNQRGDALDCTRYAINSYLLDFPKYIKTYKK